MLLILCRLRRRIESYRRRQSDCMPRFDQSFTGLCEQNLQDTLALKQRFLETKAKRQAKTKDKKQTDNATTALQSSIHVVRRAFEHLVRNVLALGGDCDSCQKNHLLLTISSVFIGMMNLSIVTSLPLTILS